MLPFVLFAQGGQGDNWYFGIKAGISFNTASGAPEAVYDGQMETNEGCASISDAQGNLLFYTDGSVVWNSQHDTMPNGNGLLGNFSSAMSSIVVPKPGNPYLYYVFTVPEGQESVGLSYSVVDMNLDGGLGDVTSEKNIYLTGPVHEAVTSVRHGGGLGYWVITHLWQTNTYQAFLIDADSVHTTPVESNCGLVYISPEGVPGGYIKTSMQGDKLACYIENVNLYMQLSDFNNITGEISNPIPILDNDGSYCLEFSPDGSRLYVSCWDYLKQYDLTQADSSSIVNSMQVVAIKEPHLRSFGAIQIAPDGKIYCVRFLSTWLSSIEQPNELGEDCIFIDSVLNLDDGSGDYYGMLGLPAFIQSFFNPANFTWEGHCIGDTTFFAITDTASQDSVFWDFGDTITGILNNSTSFFPYHIYSDTGSFQVSVIGYNNSLNDTTLQEIFIHPLPVPFLPTDTGFCEDYGVNLWPGDFQSYLWQNGSTDTSFYADTTLSVIVEVTDIHGCKATDSTHAVEHSKPLPVVIYHD